MTNSEGVCGSNRKHLRCRLQIQLVISILNQSQSSHAFVDEEGEQAREDDVEEQDLPEDAEAEAHGGEGAYLSDESAGAHAGAHRDIGHLKETCGKRPDNGSRQSGRDDYPRVPDYVGNLQH